MWLALRLLQAFPFALESRRLSLSRPARHAKGHPLFALVPQQDIGQLLDKVSTQYETYFLSDLFVWRAQRESNPCFRRERVTT